jgi:hypothetical protein
MNEIAQIRQELLAWAGLHRGKNIKEKAMPEFHKIIDRLEQLAESEAKGKVEYVDRLGSNHTFKYNRNDEASAKSMLDVFSRYANGEIRDLSIRAE